MVINFPQLKNIDAKLHRREEMASWPMHPWFKVACYFQATTLPELMLLNWLAWQTRWYGCCLCNGNTVLLLMKLKTWTPLLLTVATHHNNVALFFIENTRKNWDSCLGNGGEERNVQIREEQGSCRLQAVLSFSSYWF